MIAMRGVKWCGSDKSAKKLGDQERNTSLESLNLESSLRQRGAAIRKRRGDRGFAHCCGEHRETATAMRLRLTRGSILDIIVTIQDHRFATRSSSGHASKRRFTPRRLRLCRRGGALAIAPRMSYIGLMCRLPR